MFTRERELTLELGRQPEVVAIEKRDEAALRLFDSGLPRQCGPAIARLKDQLDARILCREAFDCGGGVVRRAIIGDQQLPVLKRLRLYRRDGFADQALD